MYHRLTWNQIQYQCECDEEQKKETYMEHDRETPEPQGYILDTKESSESTLDINDISESIDTFDTNDLQETHELN
jgi:hypothetical protein